MMTTVKISDRQFRILVILFTVGSTILITPATLAKNAKQDAWMVPLVSMAIGLLNIWFFTKVAYLYPDKTFVECLEALLGKWLGKAVGLMFAFWGFITSAALVWYVGNFITSQFMPETPEFVTNLLFVSIMIFALRLGIETIAHAAEILVPWIIVLFIAVVILLLPEVKFENLLPVMENGFKPIIKATIIHSSILTYPLIALLMVFPCSVTHTKKTKKEFYIGYLIGGSMIFLTSLFTILVLGSDITSISQFPSFLLAKKISIGNILERMEGIVAVIWIITIFFRTLFYLYTGFMGLSQVLRLKDYKYILLPSGLILAVLSLIVYPNPAYASEWNTTTWVPFVGTFALILPLVLLMVAVFRKKSKTKGH